MIDLRALYFLLAAFIHKFHFLNIGLSFVLIFIGIKMTVIDSYFDVKFPIGYSLGIVATLLVGSIVISLLKPEKIHNLKKVSRLEWLQYCILKG